MTKLQTVNLITQVKSCTQITSEWKLYLRKMNTPGIHLLYFFNVKHGCTLYFVFKEESVNTIVTSVDFESVYLETPEDSISGAWALGEKSEFTSEKLLKIREETKEKFSLQQVIEVLDLYLLEFNSIKNTMTEKQILLNKSYSTVLDLKRAGIKLNKNGSAYSASLTAKDGFVIKLTANVNDGSFTAEHFLTGQKALDLVNSNLGCFQQPAVLF